MSAARLRAWLPGLASVAGRRQARSLMAAGKNADAKKIWEELSKLEGEPVQQEATVRLGELAAKG